MDEETEPVAASHSIVSHRKILITMAVIIAVATAAGMVFSGPMFGFGVVFGGLLAVGNYIWLDRVTKAIFRPDAVRSAGLLAAKYILRYFVLGGVLLVIYLTGAFPMAAVILGLGAFAIAVVIEGLRSIVSSN
jgi:membrane-bound metal-dependent hydrolase YbcI (DUF457 family)